MKTLKVKIKSHRPGSLAGRYNAQIDLLNRSVNDFESTEEMLFAQNAPECLAKKNFNHKELLSYIKDGYFEDVEGIAYLTKKEIAALKNKNLVIVGIRGKIY